MPNELPPLPPPTEAPPPSWASAVDRRLDIGGKRMQALEDELQRNTEATERIEKSVRELLAWLEACRGAIRVLNAVGSLARPLAYVAGLATAVGSAWAAWRGITPGPQ